MVYFTTRVSPTFAHIVFLLRGIWTFNAFFTGASSFVCIFLQKNLLEIFFVWTVHSKKTGYFNRIQSKYWILSGGSLRTCLVLYPKRIFQDCQCTHTCISKFENFHLHMASNPGSFLIVYIKNMFTLIFFRHRKPKWGRLRSQLQLPTKLRNQLQRRQSISCLRKDQKILELVILGF